jgi:hypothetical protein
MTYDDVIVLDEVISFTGLIYMATLSSQSGQL